MEWYYLANRMLEDASESTEARIVCSQITSMRKAAVVAFTGYFSVNLRPKGQARGRVWYHDPWMYLLRDTKFARGQTQDTEQDENAATEGMKDYGSIHCWYTVEVRSPSVDGHDTDRPSKRPERSEHGSETTGPGWGEARQGAGGVQTKLEASHVLEKASCELRQASLRAGLSGRQGIVPIPPTLTTMSSTSRAGVPLPLPANFDFSAYMKRPADVDAPDDFDLADINLENVAREKHNKTSLNLTRLYVAAANSAAGVGAADVGAPLRPYYGYAAEDRELLIASDSTERASGPLPFFLTVEIERERTKRKNLTETARAQREAERAAKEVGPRPALGTLVMVNPQPVSSTITGAPLIPELWLTSLQHKVYFPLNFWLDDNLTRANDYPHVFPTTSLSNVPGISVLNVTKASLDMGPEDPSTLTPGLWRQASINLLSAWQMLCPNLPRTDPAFVPTPASEYESHVSYFVHQEVFEKLEFFPVWYPVEHHLRYMIFKNKTFDLGFYETRLNVALSTYHQIRAIGQTFIPPAISTPNVSAPLKRVAPSTDLNTGATKQPPSQLHAWLPRGLSSGGSSSPSLPGLHGRA
ncbi:hypothetical protein B0H11DRAFT_1905727 [Mycena galericulata]|nr:hypothetical protein B0H11DRAFT_1905727 [Mycena galericulata]